MKLALFDLDNTLLAGDSDYLWGKFLCDKNIVDAEQYAAQNQAYYAQYEAGTLNINEYLAFSLTPIQGKTAAELKPWQEQFLTEYIEPIMLEKSRKLLAEHAAHGHVNVIITATNRFITGPIAVALGIEHLIASEPEIIAGKYTGQGTGTPCFKAGKITRLKQWLTMQELDPSETWFYSDSHNDIPLLETVNHAFAVDADPTLTAHAKAQGWTCMSLRNS